MTRKINSDGVLLVRNNEGLRLKAYLDGNKIPTIGWGHTKGVKLGDVCTPEQAEAWFWEDIAEAEDGIMHLVQVPLNDNEFSALGSFVFNIGVTRFATSSALRYLNAGLRDRVPAAIKSWVFIHGKASEGLCTRRAREVALWLKPITTNQEAIA